MLTDLECLQIGCLQRNNGTAGPGFVVDLVDIHAVNLDTHKLTERSVYGEADRAIAILSPGTAITFDDIVGSQRRHQIVKFFLDTLTYQRFFVVCERIVGFLGGQDLLGFGFIVRFNGFRKLRNRLDHILDILKRCNRRVDPIDLVPNGLLFVLGVVATVVLKSLLQVSLCLFQIILVFRGHILRCDIFNFLGVLGAGCLSSCVDDID